MDIKTEIAAFARENRDNIIRDIARLVAVPSVAGEPVPGAPYGIEPRRALDTALEIAREMGLDTAVYDERVGAAIVPGESEEYIATVTHADVVPAGDGWSGDPFILREREGYIIGRGVMDDKGPTILCLYALKFLREKNIAPRHTMKALIGSAEETGMDDMKTFLAGHGAPVFAFSPDADFPLCNGEKGIYQARVHFKKPLQSIGEFSAGFAVNAVADTARAVIAAEEKLPPRAGIDRNGTEIIARGTAAHASHPEGAQNAIGLLAEYLLDNVSLNSDEREFFTLAAALANSPDGAAAGIAASDEIFGKLTMAVGTAGEEGGCPRLTVDCRYPTTMDAEKITRALKKLGDVETELISDTVPFYVPADSAPVRACLEAYAEITGRKAEPFTIGGGTYARNFPSAVSFGPECAWVKRPDFVGPIHSPDEGASIEELLQALQIYILALLKIDEKIG